MLILTRKRGEKIYIGDDIVIEIKDFQRYNSVPQVQLGIDAPREIEIHRKEKRTKKNDSDNFNS